MTGNYGSTIVHRPTGLRKGTYNKKGVKVNQPVNGIFYLLAKVQTMIVFRFPPAFNGWIIMLLVPRRLVRSHEYMTLDNNQLFEEAKDD